MTNSTKLLKLSLFPEQFPKRRICRFRRFIALCSLLFALSLSACYSGPRYLVPEGHSGNAVESQHEFGTTSSKGVKDSDEKTEVFSLDRPPSIPDLATGKTAPPTAEEYGEQLKGSGKRWFFGGGIGRTVANVSAVIVFPPYGLYLLGNAGLSLAGYKPLYVTNALPEVPRKYVRKAYDGITSVPGRLNSLVAGKDYYSD